jgi:hypothetical protein
MGLKALPKASLKPRIPFSFFRELTDKYAAKIQN